MFCAIIIDTSKSFFISWPSIASDGHDGNKDGHFANAKLDYHDILSIILPLMIYHVTMVITVHQRDVGGIAEKLASSANIPDVLVTSGRCDIIAASTFRNLDEMLNCIDGKLGSVSKLLNADILVDLNWMKFSQNPLTSINHAFLKRRVPVFWTR